MRVQSRQAQLAGCSLTYAHLEHIWEAAREGFAKPDECSRATHRNGDVEIRSATLEELVDDVGDFEKLDNLTLIAEQDEPHKHVRLDIGPGRLTTITVEADDHTWALGRHEEVKQALNRARSRVARAWDPIPPGNRIFSRIGWIALFMLAVGAGYGLVAVGMNAWQTNSLADIARSPLPYALFSYIGLFAAADRWRRNKLRSYVTRNKPRAADRTSLTSLGVAVLTFAAAVVRAFG